MAEGDDFRKNQDRLRALEDEWWAIGMGIAVIGLAIITLLSWRYVFAEGISSTERLTRVQTLAPYGVLFVAALTFVLAIWRGTIAQRQADQGREQIAALVESNFGHSLQAGAELIDRENSDGKIKAGVATLQSVAMSEDERHWGPAMEILANMISEHSTKGHYVQPVKDAIDAIDTIHSKTGRFAENYVNCTNNDIIKKPYYRILSGCNRVYFAGGYFDGVDFRKYINYKKRIIVNCRFFNSGFCSSNNYEFRNCEFTDGAVYKILVSDFRQIKFFETDFSNASILIVLVEKHVSDDDIVNTIRNSVSDCFYSKGCPPKVQIDGSRRLETSRIIECFEERDQGLTTYFYLQ